jgi:hypothetical protein
MKMLRTSNFKSEMTPPSLPPSLICITSSGMYAFLKVSVHF